MGHRDVAFAEREVKLGGKYWAWMRPLTGDEHDAVQAAMLGGPVTRFVGQDAPPVQVDNRAFKIKALSVSITKWNLDDDNNNILPINEETVAEELSAREQLELMRVYAELNQPLADEETLGKLSWPLPSSGMAKVPA